MRIGVFASEEQWKELSFEGVRDLYRVTEISEITEGTIAIIVLAEALELDFSTFTKPVFINAVATTLAEMNAAGNVIRFNGWPGCIGRKNWEISGIISPSAKNVLSILNKQALLVEDQEGFISPRVIAMIINEAFFALEEGISTRQEIDVAMKLGTNYPFGPFEWSSLIGPNRIYQLLQKLSARDKRYVPSPLLAREAVL